MTVVTYVSWDPGETTTGRTYWDECANVVDMGDLSEAEFDQEMEKIPDTVQVFIIEEYRPYSHVNHTGDKLLTAQRIGDLKGYARRKNIKIIEVPANCKPIAAMWSQTKIPKTKQGKKKHMPDWMASYLIGYWWLFQQGLIRPKVLDK
jgi:hypothetical protein